MSLRQKFIEKRQLLKDKDAFGSPIEGAMVAVAVISLMLIGVFFTGVLKTALTNSGAASAQTTLQMNNVSGYVDTSFSIISVSLIIYILGGALATIMGIFMFSKFGNQ